jgi:ribonuclease VapC
VFARERDASSRAPSGSPNMHCAVVVPPTTPTNRHQGLSLADRACIALARRLRLPALTADRTWADARVDAELMFIR